MRQRSSRAVGSGTETGTRLGESDGVAGREAECGLGSRKEIQDGLAAVRMPLATRREKECWDELTQRMVSPWGWTAMVFEGGPWGSISMSDSLSGSSSFTRLEGRESAMLGMGWLANGIGKFGQ